jgi:hypothetical protein
MPRELHYSVKLFKITKPTMTVSFMMVTFLAIDKAFSAVGERVATACEGDEVGNGGVADISSGGSPVRAGLAWGPGMEMSVMSKAMVVAAVTKGAAVTTRREEKEESWSLPHIPPGVGLLSSSFLLFLVRFAAGERGGYGLGGGCCIWRTRRVKVVVHRELSVWQLARLPWRLVHSSGLLGGTNSGACCIEGQQQLLLKEDGRRALFLVS